MNKGKLFLTIAILFVSSAFLVSADSALVPQPQELAELIMAVHDVSAEDFRNSGDRCATCHGNVFSSANVVMKQYSAEFDEISEELLRNHHRRHEKSPSANFGNDCTFCHTDIVVEQDSNGGVTVTSYVEKTSCAACHSNYNPTGRMAEEYIADGCPGCHGDGDEWVGWHFDADYAPDVARRFVDTYNIPFGTDWCLECHGFNRFIVSQEAQDAWWKMTFEERNAYLSERGLPWTWVEPEAPVSTSE